MALQNMGVDGCEFGWICVYRSFSDTCRVSVVERLEDLDLSRYEHIAIDIPIGLSTAGSRGCDLEARKVLASRGCCVFPAPVRDLLEAPTYRAACDRSEEIQGKRISQQAWNIIPKIREVDVLLQKRPALIRKLYEVHPEVSFCFMNSGTPLLNPKRKRSGKDDRIKLVELYLGDGAFDRLKESAPFRKGWGDDDLLDACAALWSAERIASGVAGAIPAIPTHDSLGMPMRIVY